MTTLLWLLASLVVLGTLVLSVALDESLYSLKRLRRKHRLGMDRAINYDYRAKDGIIALGDNRLLVAWRVKGPDLDGSTYAQQAAHVAAHNEAMRKRDESWCLDYYDFCEPASGYPSGNAAPDPTTAVMAWARKRRYSKPGHLFTHEQYIVATYAPPAQMVDSVGKMLAGDSKQQADADAQYAAALRRFEQEINELESALGTVFELRRLTTRRRPDGRHCDELVSFLHRTITGEKVELECERPQDVMRILSAHDFQGGMYPHVDGTYVAVVAIEDTPPTTVPGLLDELVSIRTGYCRATKMVFIEQEHARRIARGSYYRQREASQSFFSKISSRGEGGGVVDPGALENAEEARQVLGDVTRGFVKYLFWSTRIVLRDRDPAELTRRAAEVKSAILRRGFAARVETFNAAESFIAHLPGDIDHDRSPLVLDTIAASDLTRIGSNELGSSTNPNPMFPAGSPALYRMLTYGSQPFDLTLSEGDIQHTFFVAPTGAGKSTIINTLVAAARAQYPGTQAFIFDQGRSAHRLCLASGGDFYDLNPWDSHASVGFAPLQNIDIDSERAWAAEWIERDLLGLQGLTLDPERQRRLMTALVVVSRLPREERTISALQFQLRGIDRDMAEALEFYTITGALGRLLDSGHDSLGTSTLQVFEMSTLMRRKDERVIVPTLQYIFHRIDHRLGILNPKTGLPVFSIVALDESPEYLRHPSFASTINYWLDKARKRNAAIWLATLRLNDFMKLPIADAILDSCVNKLFLPNPEANGMLDLYMRAGCTQEDVARIASAIKKRHIYIMQSGRRALVNTDIDPVELAFTGSSRPDDIKQTERLWRMHGKQMGGALLRELELVDAANRWEQFAQAGNWITEGEHAKAG